MFVNKLNRRDQYIFVTITLSEKRYYVTNNDLVNLRKTLENKKSVLPQTDISLESEVNTDHIEYISDKTKIEGPFIVRYCTLVETITKY